MPMLRFTLLSDGSSDRMLIPILEWLLDEIGVTAQQVRWANKLYFSRKCRTLFERANEAVSIEPCDILFIHRDAETASLAERLEEIRNNLEGLQTSYVRIVPVRMSEAWLLVDESAIRKAAGNPTGRDPLDLPKTRALESLPDPKDVLRAALRKAANVSGRRARKFERDLRSTIHRVGEYIEDFTPLRKLPAFMAFEAELTSCLEDFTHDL
jgi:hypothetical protein